MQSRISLIGLAHTVYFRTLPSFYVRYMALPVVLNGLTMLLLFWNLTVFCLLEPLLYAEEVPKTMRQAST